MKKVIILMLSLCLILTSFFLLQKLLIPKYISDVPEGSLIEEYYNEKVFDHDVVFIGDCEVYENISPYLTDEEKAWLKVYTKAI